MVVPGPVGTPAEHSRVLRDSVALGLAVGAFGISFGALAVTAGLSAWQAQARSLLMFTGGSQYALVGVLAAGGGAGSALGVAWLLGARNTLYAVRLADLVGLRGLRGAVLGQLVIDERAAMATRNAAPSWPAGPSGPPGPRSTCAGISGRRSGP